MTPALPLAFLPPTILGVVLLAILVGWTLREAARKDSAFKIGWKWWLLAALTVLSFRWPLLWTPHQMNPDESQLIAGAITLRHDPVFWRSVDGGTAGPFDYYPLLPAAWGDGPASYAIARLIGVAAMLGALFFLGETLAVVAGTTIARVALLPAITFQALTTSPDFIHCSTEVMPVLLFSAAGYVAVAGQDARSTARLWLVGLLLGSMPWAKLQATPLAAGLWAAVALHELRAHRPRALFPLLAGGLLPTLGCFALTTFTGETANMLTPYLARNLVYVQNLPDGRLLLQWRNALTDGYLAFWLAGTAVFVTWSLWRMRRAPEKLRLGALVGGGLLALSVWSVIAPSRPSTHHLLLLLPALVWTGGVALAVIASPATPTAPAKNCLLLAAFFLIVCVLPSVAWRWHAGDTFAAFTQTDVRPARRRLTELVRRYSTPDEPLAIWGWRTSLYVEAGRRQATRQAQSEAQIYPNALQGYFLRRYFEDFRAANPAVFADAVGPGNFVFEDRSRAHECFPLLRNWVQARYTLVADLDGTRLYVRDDRLPGAHAFPLPAPRAP
ncbi:MAG: hypothetical protein ABI222_02630 [Opitutaceae bacterium]